jgi:hypothetical protein
MFFPRHRTARNAPVPLPNEHIRVIQPPPHLEGGGGNRLSRLVRMAGVLLPTQAYGGSGKSQQFALGTAPDSLDARECNP